MKKEHKTILKVLKEYLESHPDQRFGQALRNLYLQNFVDEKYPDQFQSLLKDIYNDEDIDIISRMLKKKYDKAKSDSLKLTLCKDLTKKDYQWLNHDFNKGENAYLYTGETHNCIGKNGIACTKTGELPFFELPATALSIKHNDKEFGIFMTEQGMGYQLLYCKELPIDHMQLLTQTQSNVHLVDPKKKKPAYKPENQILKVYVNGPYIHRIDGQLEDVEPLF